MKMGDEIAYLMLTKYKIFLGKGNPPGASSLDPRKHLAHRLSFQQNWMTPMQHKPASAIHVQAWD